MITLEEYITIFEITPVSADGIEGLRDIAEARANLVILGDKGYVGESLSQELAKSFQDLCTRLANKILAYNLCLALNSLFMKSVNLEKSNSSFSAFLYSIF